MCFWDHNTVFCVHLSFALQHLLHKVLYNTALLLHLNIKLNGDAGKGLFGDASGGKGGTQEGEWDKQTWQLKVEHAGRQFDN